MMDPIHLAMRTGIFAEGRFLGRVVDGWADDAQDFVRTKLPHLLLVAIVAWMLNRTLRIITRHMIQAAEQHAAGHGRVAQVKTLAGIIHTTGVTVITLIAGMLILDKVGINLGPLLASAGIAGVAIGLAAQSLVKDMLNGLFILIEDQFNMGDRVRVAGLTGTVEAMTLRKTTVRDDDGTLYVIPNSQIATVANLSAGYSVATVNVSVDFSANPDLVLGLLTRIANEVREDEAFRQLFVAEPQILGVDALKGSELIFPVVFKTLATRQYGPVREFKRRVRLALEEQKLLPGDPFRVFSGFGEQRPVAAIRQAEEAAVVAQDPTIAKPLPENPFAGE
ncbi:mechanosensitive ion channel family protein [Telmatobacter bradus]|uniref:mechanosensitive ion channel family protein n=1 Tax=Telmatobacter bradus TaxID=474953 RepID=UPI003B43A48A